MKELNENFFKKVMIKLCYDIKWVNKIKNCISMVKFSVISNGEIRERYSSKKNQTNIFCAEALSCLIKKGEMSGKINGVQYGMNKVKGLHLLFYRK